MNIKLNKVILHNFLSIGDAEVNLDNQGYVLVSGRNENPDDNSISNGSGKSTTFESIVWCLTGETIRGTKDIERLNSDDGTYVGIEMMVDGHQYKILRSKNHKKYKTNLLIHIDGVDKSGKGIKDSSELLKEYLPDLTSSLLGSVIVLGQGLPQRFTNNTPAGRKEVLEKLSKSDFMIEDLKERIATRKDILSKQLREVEDRITSDVGKQSIYESQLNQKKVELSNMDSKTLDEDIINNTKELDATNIALNEIKKELDTATETLTNKRQEYINLVECINAEIAKVDAQYPSMNDIDKKYPSVSEIESKYLTISEINAKYPTATEIEKQFPTSVDIAKTFPSNSDIEAKYKDIETLRESISELNSHIIALDKEIKEKDNITDICPTCGQKLKGVVKIDITPLKENLSNLTSQKISTSNSLTDLIKKRDDEKSSVEKQILEAQKENAKLIQDAKNKVEQDKKSELDKINLEKRAEIEKVEKEKNAEKNKIIEEINKKKAEINEKYSKKRETLTQEGIESNNKVSEITKTFNDTKSNLDKISATLTRVKLEREQFDKTKNTLEKEIKDITTKLQEFSEKILYNNSERDNLVAHQEVITKFETAVKRDFRGYLLTNVIEYIRKKAQEYSMDVFETDKIEFNLDKNNIDIGYNGKEYSSLSGGEKQKVDLIVQFAIRDMLCNYLGFSANMIVLDEITDNLDYLGCQKVINLISNKLSDVSSIYIISHRKDLEIPCDRELVVVKSKEGISSIQ